MHHIMHGEVHAGIDADMPCRPLLPSYGQRLGTQSQSLAPYIKTLPPRDAVMSYYDIPTSYMPLIQHEILVRVQMTDVMMS